VAVFCFAFALYRKVSVEPEARATGISTSWWLLEASRLGPENNISAL
jgi:hypothetical protein